LRFLEKVYARVSAWPFRDIDRGYFHMSPIFTINSFPLENSKIVLTIHGKDYIRKTDMAGNFQLSPEYFLYVTWTLCGPIYSSEGPPYVGVSVDTYKTVVLWTNLKDIPQDKRKYVSQWPAKRTGSYLILGDINMKKR
jgi:hypothetical protein